MIHPLDLKLLRSIANGHVDVGEPVRLTDRPWPGPPAQRGVARRADRVQHRREAGDVEVRDPVRDLELRALLGGVELGGYGSRS